MTLHEPATFLTDCLLGALAAGLAGRLHRRTPAGPSAARGWVVALVLTSLSAFVGGSHHGFAPEFPVAVQRAWWVATLWIICVLGAAMAFALVAELVPSARQRGWRTLIVLLLGLAAGAAWLHPDFVVAVVYYGLSLLAWLVAALVLRRPWRGAMLLGVGLSLAAAVVQQSGWALSPHFNHNDLYHVIQALALVAFYRAALKLHGGALAE